MRWIVAILLLLAPVSAWAQCSGGPAPQQPFSGEPFNCAAGPTPQSTDLLLGGSQSQGALGGGKGTVSFTTGQLLGAGLPASFGSVNNLSPAGYKQNGTTILNVIGTLNPNTVGGPNAGLLLSPSASLNTIFGDSAGQHISTTTEAALFGSWAGQFLTTGAFPTAIGMHAMGYETTGGFNTSVGNDSMRNTVGVMWGSALGKYAYANHFGSFGTALGGFALTGNAAAAVVGGTVTTGDGINLTFTDATLVGSPVTISYTTLPGDTLNSIASGICANAFWGTNNITCTTNGLVVGAVIIQHNGNSTAGDILTVTGTVTGAATETLTITGGSMGNYNIGIGYDALQGEVMSTAHNNTGIGDNTGLNLTTGNYNFLEGSMSGQSLTTGSRNDCRGFETCQAMTTANDWVVDGYLAASSVTTGIGGIAIGSAACQNATTDNDIICIGQNAGLGAAGGRNNIWFGLSAGRMATTGSDNIVFGPQDNSTSQGGITTGNSNLEIGYNMIVPSPTTSNQMSIMNMVYGTGLSGSNHTVSPGLIGIGTTAPNATLTVGDPASGSGPHIGVLATAPPAVTGCTSCTLNATASDTHGTLTEGTAQTGFVLTFEVPFQTAPDCTVTSPSGNVFTSYTPSTTTLTLVNASQTASKYSYVCLQ